MRNARLNWTLPTTRIAGGALTEAEIAETEISMSADLGANYVVVANLAPPDVEFIAIDLDVGTYMFRAVVVDTAGSRSDVAEAQGEVLDDSPPSPIADLTVTIE